MKSNRYVLLFSDLEVGHPELGFVSREDCRDPDEEDIRFQRMLVKQGCRRIQVHDGIAQIGYIPAPMDMTDEQLVYRLEVCDPHVKHDDLHEPDGKLAEYWREAGKRRLLERG
ncbi:MAG TPA: hypothetical protein VIE65_12450 [Methylobacter sp.]|jgi:hypothetical protein